MQAASIALKDKDKKKALDHLAEFCGVIQQRVKQLLELIPDVRAREADILSSLKAGNEDLQLQAAALLRANLGELQQAALSLAVGASASYGTHVSTALAMADCRGLVGCMALVFWVVSIEYCSSMWGLSSLVDCAAGKLMRRLSAVLSE